MAEKRFKKQKLNRSDHKKQENNAKVVRKGIGFFTVMTPVIIGLKKNGPKIVKGIANVIKKA